MQSQTVTELINKFIALRFKGQDDEGVGSYLHDLFFGNLIDTERIEPYMAGLLMEDIVRVFLVRTNEQLGITESQRDLIGRLLMRLLHFFKLMDDEYGEAILDRQRVNYLEDDDRLLHNIGVAYQRKLAQWEVAKAIQD